MKEKIRYILLLITIIFTGCEKNIKDGLFPEFNQKLVITSFISPNDSVSLVWINSNNRIFGEMHRYDDLGKISGTISDGNKEVNLKMSPFGLCFDKNDIRVEAGRTYSIKVVTDQGFTAKGTTTVPDEFDFGLRVDTSFITGANNGYSWKELKINTEFRDQPGKENYYRFLVFFQSYKNFNGPIPYADTRQMNPDKNFLTESDLNAEGKYTFSTTMHMYYPNTPNDSSILKVYLLNCDKSYYLYHKSLDNYSDNENPFTEASPVYSNINGGLGIFTSYTIDSLIIRLR